MNQELRITERIDEALNILNAMPLRGYDQWRPAVEIMARLAGISQDIAQYEAKQESPDQPGDPAEAKPKK